MELKNKYSEIIKKFELNKPGLIEVTYNKIEPQWQDIRQEVEDYIPHSICFELKRFGELNLRDSEERLLNQFNVAKGNKLVMGLRSRGIEVNISVQIKQVRSNNRGRKGG